MLVSVICQIYANEWTERMANDFYLHKMKQMIATKVVKKITETISIITNHGGYESPVAFSGTATKSHIKLLSTKTVQTYLCKFYHQHLASNF